MAGTSLDAPSVTCGTSQATSLSAASSSVEAELILDVAPRRTELRRVTPDAGWVAAPVTFAGNPPLDPSAASGPSGYMVTWVDWRLEGDVVYAMRVDPDGTPLDPRAVVISPPAETIAAPRVIWSGARWVFEYHEIAAATGGARLVTQPPNGTPSPPLDLSGPVSDSTQVMLATTTGGAMIGWASSANLIDWRFAYRQLAEGGGLIDPAPMVAGTQNGLLARFYAASASTSSGPMLLGSTSAGTALLVPLQGAATMITAPAPRARPLGPPAGRCCCRRTWTCASSP
jgi:hypothetical protein